MTDPRSTGPRAGDAAGVTLVELMVVLVFIAIGVMALSGIQTRSSDDVYKTGRHSRALALAEQRMEITRSVGFSLAQSDTGQADGFNWVTQVDSLGSDSLKQVTVTVSWTEAGVPRTVQLDNLMADR